MIKVRSVKSQLLEPGYGYLRVTQFQVNSGEEVGKALAKLKKDNGGKKLNGLVLDLRNNPGGVLQAAVVMGTDSFGKGSVQTVLPLNNDRGAQAHHGALLRPRAARSAQGIEPDIVVERAKLTREQAAEGFREADLAGHLGNGNGGPDRPASTQIASDSDRPQDDDYQLGQALNLLKGLNLTRGQ